ncbi:MAG TPA: DUF3800 domain-containing protein [Capsulimonadaceae bacterium]|jgi:hypothetical protein
MEIYIDESGNFAPRESTPWASCVAAMTVPSKKSELIFEEFIALKSKWNLGEGEIKGHRLGEGEISQTIGLLKRHDVLLHIGVFDGGSHKKSDVAGFREVQAAKVCANLGPEHHPDLVEEMKDIEAQTARMSLPLFAQMITTVKLFNKIIEESPMYFVQRDPEELGHFKFVIDAKDTSLTTSERVWSVLLPMFMHRSVELVCIEGFDYSHFDAAYGVELADNPVDSTVKACSLGKLLKDDFNFKNSESDIGLQIVDILANGFCRALNRQLKQDGRGEFGALMINRRDGSTVQPIILRANPVEFPIIVRSQNYQGWVLQQMSRNGRSMLLEAVSE